MNTSIKRFILASLTLIFSCGYAVAQEGAYSAYSPYSVYGIGSIVKEGSVYNKSMGGVGVAMRTNRFVNYSNPASLTARDTLSFMADYGMEQQNIIYSQNDIRSAKNLFNLSNFVMSFPIWNKNALMIGLTPFNNVGYDFSYIEKDPQVIAKTGNIDYQSYGEGGMTQLFLGGGAKITRELSLGAEFIYYFGKMNKCTNMLFSNSSYRSMYGGYDIFLNGVTGKFGAQYEKRLSKDVSLTAGATYRLSSKMSGYCTDYSYAILSEVTDTLRNQIDTITTSRGLKVADELGVGVSLRVGDKWFFELDYLRSDWTKSNFENVKGFNLNSSAGDVMTSKVSQSFRFGMEFIPNRSDIRYYYKRMSYRLGAYYDQEYYKLNGNEVNTFGVTFGVTLPVFRWYNGISLGADIGQRGTNTGGMIRERYAKFYIGINIHDLWFQKTRYK